MVISWLGTNSNLQSIVLNSHMDTVSCNAENWTHSPYAADIDSDGRIYARGTQDTKSIGVQYLAAIHSLKLAGVTNQRTIHVTFAPGRLDFFF